MRFDNQQILDANSQLLDYVFADLTKDCREEHSETSYVHP